MATRTKRKYKNPYRRLGLVLLCLVILLEALLYARTPLIQAKSLPLRANSSAAPSLPWPTYGQSALGAQGFSYIRTSGEQKPEPIASVAKTITALAVLKQKPLSPGQPGPTLTLGQSDVNYYQNYVTNDGSVVLVQDGEQISEYQALEAMLLPSANNMAESLATWAFGSVQAYTAFANQYLASLGTQNTHVADASGFSPSTVGSAQDLVKIGKAAIANPVLAQIVGQKQADVPVAGTIYNTNWMVGTDGLIGIKTGNTNEAGGCFLFAAVHQISGQNVTIVGAVMNAPDLVVAMQDSRTLLRSADANFDVVTAVQAGQPVLSYQSKWQDPVLAVAQKDVKLLVQKGQPISLKISRIPAEAPEPAGGVVGNITAISDNQRGDSPIILKTAIKKTPLRWRLLRL